MSLAIDMLCRLVSSRSRWLAGVALHTAILGACTFAPEGPGLTPSDTGPPPPPSDAMRDADPGRDTIEPPVDAPPDAPPPGPRNVVHVPEDGWAGNTGDATWTGDVTIDTSALSISGPGTEGLGFRTSAHDPAGGPELALLHVGTLTINDGVDVRVTGSRPLVIISAGDIVLNGRIDAGADRQTAGAGGAGPGEGAGAGQAGDHTDQTSNDGGGGGAGHATAGARGALGCSAEDNGGNSCDDSDVAEGGPGGAAYGEAALATLFGGSGGGRGGEGGLSCPGGQGGAGGGAVQLYALGTITVGSNGGVSVGGGGGQGGDQRDFDCAASGGGGGGSGGSVYLQADSIRLDGVIAANGGGGGAASEGAGRGQSGEDGTLGTTPAAGGPDPGNGGTAGGAGAAGGSGPQQGVDQDDEPNGGGGGGAAGRIFLNCNGLEGTGRVSPIAIATAGCLP